MGTALQRSAFSPNIRERLDFSCAVFDSEARLLAQAAHIPVHLGSMPELIRRMATLQHRPGDVLVANDPQAGGTHLPDITMVAPIFIDGLLLGYAAARAHHADVGGAYPGSMGPATEIFQEGLILPIVRLYREGEPVEDLWSLILRNVRTPREREGDLLAQLAACRTAQRRLENLVARYGRATLIAHGVALLDYSERLARAELAALPQGEAEAEDWLEFGDELILIRCKLRLADGGASCDFTGTAASVKAPLNAPLAVTRAAVIYCFQCLFGDRVPVNEGLFRPIEVSAPRGTVVHAQHPDPVAAGNVETSQRVVDVVMAALRRLCPGRIGACAAGTMNNLTVGGPGPFAYYETSGGGYGGSPLGAGASGVQIHMTNTRNTPAEALESEMPLRLWRYALRPGSGGAGRHPGGQGLVRELEFLREARVSLLATRRRIPPPGAEGGSSGQPGRDHRVAADGSLELLPGQFTRIFPPGERIRLETPGGGGWGISKV
jgi:N-methylhydantoinase B/oxoprolinase/acetone carboxylase alpha subunit